MKRWEILVVAAVHLAAMTGAYAAWRLTGRTDPVVACIVAAAAGTLVGAGLFARRAHAIAGLRVKGAVGLLLAGLCIAVAAAGQWAWQWMADATMTTILCAAVSLVLPIILFGTAELIFMRPAKKHYKYS